MSRYINSPSINVRQDGYEGIHKKPKYTENEK